jgi:hypothetical protein
MTKRKIKMESEGKRFIAIKLPAHKRLRLLGVQLDHKSISETIEYLLNEYDKK